MSKSPIESILQQTFSNLSQASFQSQPHQQDNVFQYSHNHTDPQEHQFKITRSQIGNEEQLKVIQLICMTQL